MYRTTWKKDIVSWKLDRKLYLSIPFTWCIPEANEIIKNQTKVLKQPVYVGGPAVDLMPNAVGGIKGADPVTIPLLAHNSLATFTTRGCVNKCKFCAVPKIEGELVELDDWRAAPIVCDNNLLAASKKHFNKVIDALKKIPYVDFSQGLDARLFNSEIASRLAELKHVKVRFAFDNINFENRVSDALNTAKKAGLKDFGVYVLIGFDDSPDEAKYKLEKVRKWGAYPYPMRYQPLDCLVKNSYVGENWTSSELKKMVRYYSRLIYLEHITYDDFSERMEQKDLF